MSDWNSMQYLKFNSERTQPSIDLVNRLNQLNPKKIIDIGCGPGNSTAVLSNRFTNTYILGIDSSPNMIETAKESYPYLDFLLYDASRDLQLLDKDFDLVFSNACIQWIPKHDELLKNMMKLLTPGGVLAVQTPMNKQMHKLIIKVANSAKWSAKVIQTRIFNNLTPSEYYDVLADISSDFSIWKTIYFHKMKSYQDIIEWYRSTGLRPYLNALKDEDKLAFEQDVYEKVKEEYPEQKNGEIIFPFPRLFFTAIR